MGHSHGRRWNESDVETEILKVVDVLKLDRMPSKKEIEIANGNSSLTNIIAKTGGFYHWGNKLDLKIKTSETKLGLEYEDICFNYLTSIGIKCEKTPVRFPYDIYVGKFSKIDVKVSNITQNGYYTCNLEYLYPKSDFVVMYCISESKINKTYIIPSYMLMGLKQLSVGLNSSKYDEYIDRWDLISTHESKMSEIYK